MTARRLLVAVTSLALVLGTVDRAHAVDHCHDLLTALTVAGANAVSLLLGFQPRVQCGYADTQKPAQVKHDFFVD